MTAQSNRHWRLYMALAGEIDKNSTQTSTSSSRSQVKWKPLEFSTHPAAFHTPLGTTKKARSSEAISRLASRLVRHLLLQTPMRTKSVSATPYLLQSPTHKCRPSRRPATLRHPATEPTNRPERPLRYCTNTVGEQCFASISIILMH